MRITIACLLISLVCLTGTTGAVKSEVMQPEDILNTRYATSAVISPDGKWIAHTVSTPRAITEKAGARHVELHVVSTRTGESRPYLAGSVSVALVKWRPDGSAISFLMKRGGEDAVTQVWTIPFDGGEATQATNSGAKIYDYAWHPDGRRIIYTATQGKSKRQKKLDEMGYGFVFYEEDVERRNLYVEDISDDNDDARALHTGMSVWTLKISPDGKWIGLSASPENLIDQRYVFRHIYLYDLENGELTQFSNNPGKLGKFAFSPDNSRIAYTAAMSKSDNQVSQLFVQTIGEDQALNLTIPDYRGHVEWAGWKNNSTVVYLASEGVWSTLSLVPARGGKHTVIFDGKSAGYSIMRATYAPGFEHMALTASSPEMPLDVFYFTGKGKPRRVTELNPWIAERDLAAHEVMRYKARDGWDVDGLLYYPVEYEPGTKHPLVVFVHGGPESHYGYEWRNAYQRPIEVLAGRGYAVFLPNYRASTGYGLAHTEAHLGDPAGVEFDDIADGIRHLIDIGLVDPERVGLGGGSYGGFAAAWFSTYYTELVKASIMFVGLSNLISRQGTTDIAYEELYVHSGDDLENMWQINLERSPIYWAHQSRTATLILSGLKDTRVHPSQSLEMFRRMKMNDHPAVRLVQYPGEGHGNKRIPGRRDVLYRTLQWYDWYVKSGRSIDDGMPEADISDQYQLELPEKEKEKDESPLP